MTNTSHEQILFDIKPCSLGSVIVGWTNRGVCHVAFGDDGAALGAGLTVRFSTAEIAASENNDWVFQVVDAVEHASPLGIPLDVRGTAFQERVWQRLRAIPAGETRTYSQIAAQLDAPRSVRAVANACAANEIAVAIPCHRVVRSDGGLGGYRWGLPRKRALLSLEAGMRESLPIPQGYRVFLHPRGRGDALTKQQETHVG